MRVREIAVVGVSTSPVCGVRDHAELLAEALDREGVRCRVRWLARGVASPRPGSLRPVGSAGAAESGVRRWMGELGAELRRDPPDAVLLHYSVFSFAHRGVPLLVPSTLSALRRSRLPLITVLHEFAYPWRRRGWRGTVWALTQRAALVEVVRASTAAIATTDFQAEWLASRPWLPRRRVVVAPVFSNLPPATAAPQAEPEPESLDPGVARMSEDASPGPIALAPNDHRANPGGARTRPVVGLFGYSAEGAAVALTLDAIRLLKDRGTPVELRLLGAPGPHSSAGERWLDGAQTRRVADALSFSGILAPQALADALAACEILLFAEADGPTSRKGTLAASLASGRPVLAIDGPRCWSQLIRAGAVQLVQPAPRALAGAIEAALADERMREVLGSHGRAFAAEVMSPAHSAHIVHALLDDALAVQPRQAERAAR